MLDVVFQKIIYASVLFCTFSLSEQLNEMKMTNVEVSLQHHATRSLPIHGVAIATGDSSLRSLHGYQPPLIHNRCRSNGPCVIDGISLLPRQPGQQ